MSEHTTREVEGVTIVDVADSYSRQTFLELLNVTQEIVERGPPKMLINMARLPQISSEGIGLLVLIHDKCAGAGGGMALCSVPGMVAHVLKLAGVRAFFKIYPDEREGVAAFTRGSARTLARREEADKATEKTEAERRVEAVASDPRTLAEAAHEIVRTVIRSRRHQDALEYFRERTMKSATVDQVAYELGIPRLAAEHVMRDFSRNGVVVEDGEVFTWQPSPEAEEKLAIFSRAISKPRLRTRVMAWLYAEEKK